MEIDGKNPKDFQGYTPLHYAAEEGHYQICKLFIENGMQLDVKNNSNKMPLTLAYEKGHENVIDLIGYESYAQNLDLENTLGNTTILHIIAERDNLKMCENIVTKIEDKNPKDSHGNIPLHIAATKGHFSVCKLFIENGMDLNSTNNVGETPLHFAAENGHYDICKLFVENGVKMSTKNGKKIVLGPLSIKNRFVTSPLQRAKEKGHIDIVELIAFELGVRSQKESTCTEAKKRRLN